VRTLAAQSQKETSNAGRYGTAGARIKNQSNLLAVSLKRSLARPSRMARSEITSPAVQKASYFQLIKNVSSN
jgi:hypothetical protein